jgi:hypothetical protein
MSVGRYIMRPRVFQGRVFAAWALANAGAVVVVANVTTRLSLVGTSRRRLGIDGTSQERLSTIGTSGRRLGVIGSSEQ